MRGSYPSIERPYGKKPPDGKIMLEGHVIGIEEAHELYGLNKQSIYRWIEKGYIRVVKDQRGGGRGRKRLWNKADVVYIALLKERIG